MNEFEAVQKTTEKIIDAVNESGLSGMTVYYMLGDIQRMVLEQIQSASNGQEGEVDNE